VKALFDGIFAAYAASTVPTYLTALYQTEADPRAVFPYGVFQMVVDTPADFATRGFTENNLVQFNLFDDAPDMTRLLEAYVALRAAFDFAALTVVGTTVLSCVWESTLQTRVEKVWQINVQYRVETRV